ncbi:hypothetical protein [Pseudonocardia pini]|uniref:hypothetical protein n=1 Tax=Pseudonocardia pini TaxID=2758030 RepID=UPI0015F11B4B|nr:hypothetical protein [Pseudonocardia pini]
MGFLVLQCVVAAVLVAVGVMFLAVGSLAIGGVVTLGALVWLLLCVRRMEPKQRE